MDYFKIIIMLKLPAFTFLGAFTLYVLNRLHNKQPFSLFTALNVDMGSAASAKIILFDMFLSSVIGTLVVVPLTSPSTVPQAIIAGLGMTGILSASSNGGNNNG